VDKPEIVADIKRAKAGDLGVTVADVSSSLRLLVGGEQVSTYEEHGEQYEVHLRAEHGYRANEDVLALLSVPSTKNGQVAWSSAVRCCRWACPRARIPSSRAAPSRDLGPESLQCRF